MLRPLDPRSTQAVTCVDRRECERLAVMEIPILFRVASKMDKYQQISCLDLKLNIIILSPQILNLFDRERYLSL